MATPLLTTKLYIPPLRPELVSRPRLIERMSQVLPHRLTVISAPAGFGKTTLLSEWAHRCKSAKTHRVAWLSLDNGDNDIATFWSYFIAALQAELPGTGEAALTALQSSHPPAIDAVLTTLINDLAAPSNNSSHPPEIAVVLDDYHLIESQDIHDSVAFMLDHMPSQVHLVIAGRSDPSLPLPRLRGRGQMTELRTADLRFTPTEIASFLSKMAGVELSEEDIAALDERTEGWAVGLQMAALSIQGLELESISSFIAAFTGSNRYVLDYLVEEVLHQQPPNVQRFLLQTAVLDRLTGSLCDAVTEQPGSQEILEHLERANLFIVPLDDERRWYRYHQLFANLLCSRIEQTEPGLIPSLYQRASAWYSANGLIAEAVNYASMAGDIERVAKLVEKNALLMIYHGQLATLEKWLAGLPDQAMLAWPWLSIAHAWVRAYSGELDAVEPLLREAEENLSRVEKDSPEKLEWMRIKGHITAIRGYCAVFQEDSSRAIELTRQALEFLPEDDLTTRCFTAILLGVTLGIGEDLEEGIRILTENLAISRAADDALLTTMVLCDLASLLRVQGELNRSAEACYEALALVEQYTRRSGRHSPVVGFAYSRLSGLMQEWNDLESALHYANQAVELGTLWGQRDSLLISYTYLAQTLQSSGDPVGAIKAIQRARQIAKEISASQETEVSAQEAIIRLRQGNLKAVERWAQTWTPGPNERFQIHQLAHYRAMAKLLIAQKKGDQVLDLLEKPLQAAGEMGARDVEIRLLVLRAIALHQCQHTSQALEELGRALYAAEPEGHVRTFIDEEEPMAKLLQLAADKGIAAKYATHLLEEMERIPRSQQRRPEAAASILIEPLTEREIDVLKLLDSGLSNKEIAQTLIIAVGTVKNHLKNIYGKLEVHNRTEAARRARELDIL